MKLLGYIGGMKTFLFGFCLCLSLPVAAQTPAPLPVDSLTHKITYTGVVLVAGASKAELYSRAREWFAATFGSSKAVLEMDDREAGKLIGKAYAQFDFSGVFGQSLPWAMWRVIKVEVKDGRYRYTLDGFGLGGSIEHPGESKPLEPWLAGAARPAGKMVSKMTAKMVLSITTGVQETASAEVASLQKAMAPKAGSDF